MTLPASPSEKSIVFNVLARRRFTAALLGDEDAPIPQGMTGREAVEALDGWVYKKPGMATKEDCIAACDEVHQRFGQAEVIALLQRFGVETLGGLWIGRYQDFVTFAKATITHDVPPSGSWNGDTPINYEDEL